MHGEGYIGHGYGTYPYSFGGGEVRKAKNFGVQAAGVQAAGVQAAGVRPDAVPFPPMPEPTQETMPEPTKPEPVSMTEPWPVPTTFDALLCSTKDDKAHAETLRTQKVASLRRQLDKIEKMVF